MKYMLYHTLEKIFSKLNFFSVLPVCIFLLFIIIGFLTTPDFGVSVDEPIQRQHRLINFKYIATTLKFNDYLPSHIKQQPELQEYDHRFYGVTSQMPLIFMEYNHFFDYRNRIFWYVSHYFTHGIFLLSGIYFYKTLKILEVNKFVVVFMTILYFLHPRIYAHSFYNIKDSLFLSLFTINLYYLLRMIISTTPSKIIFLSTISALLTNARIVGAFIPLMAGMYILFFHKGSLQKKISLLFILSISFIGIFILITPVLWENTLNNFSTMIGLSASYNRWNNNLIFNGNIIRGSEIPFNYLPTWIGITTPLGHLLLWILAILSSPIMLKHNNFNIRKRLIGLFCLIIISLSYVLILVLNSRLYGDWRHLYYIFGPLNILGAIFLDYLIHKNFRYVFSTIVVLIIFSLFLTIKWMYVNHPHYYVYFNRMTSSNWDKKWDRDIWRLSTKQAVELVLKDNNDKNQTTYLFNGPNIMRNTWIIPGKLRNNLVLTKERQESDFIILDYRAIRGYYPKDIIDNFILYKSITVDGKPISSIYIKEDLVR